MQAITDFFMRNMIAVYFFYGLAFFAMGLALALTARRPRSCALPWRSCRVWPPLDCCTPRTNGTRWFERIALETRQGAAQPARRTGRLGLLVASFAMLLCFAVQLLMPAATPRRRIYAPVAVLVVLWVSVSLVYARIVQTPPLETVADWPIAWRATASAIPGAALGAWALMRQQRVLPPAWICRSLAATWSGRPRRCCSTASSASSF